MNISENSSMSNSTDLLLSLDNIGYHIGKKSILRQVDLKIHEGEIVTIVGPNGAGKTTLLSIALGLIKPTTGKVSRQRINRQSLRIGYVPQSLNRDYSMPINVMEFMQLSKRYPKKSVVTALLDELQVANLQQSFVSDLSGGELRRVLFARALLNHPNLLVLDEPTAGVDATGQANFYHQLNLLQQRYGFSVLMVSHDLHLVMSATDRVICLNQHICCQGQPEQVVNNPHYRALFACEIADNQQQPELALYQHHHDHSHDIPLDDDRQNHADNQTHQDDCTNE